MASTVEQIKARLTIADVIQSYVKLQKAGANFKANCPFHHEKTPSFFVSPARESFHCFGCGRGGDIFSFVEEIEGIEFYDALKLLADRAGVVLERASAGERSERAALLALLDDAARYYESNLMKRQDVGEYLKSRGLLGVTAKKFRVGYALPEWDGALNHLRGRGYTDEQIAKAGLVSKSETQKHYDRFRARIMFPLSDSTGRIVGFSGRVFEPDAGDTPGGKYINTPETPVYDKSRVLYAFAEAKDAIRNNDCVVLVEGQMDVLMSHQAGVENAVAASGTSFTDGHAELIGRFTRNIAIAFDTDDAGFAALARAVPIALAHGFSVSAVPLPEGTDPADVVRDNPEAWKRAVLNRTDVITFYLAHLKAKHAGNPRSLVLDVTNLVVPYVARVPNAIEASRYVQEIAGAVGVGEDAVRAEVRKAAVRTPSGIAPNTEPQVVAGSRLAALEKRLTGFAAWRGDDSELVRELVGARLDTLTDTERAALAMEAELVYAGMDSLDAEAGMLARDIQKERLKLELREKERAIKAAESAEDRDAAHSLLVECQGIIKQLTAL